MVNHPQPFQALCLNIHCRTPILRGSTGFRINGSAYQFSQPVALQPNHSAILSPLCLCMPGDDEKSCPSCASNTNDDCVPNDPSISAVV